MKIRIMIRKILLTYDINIKQTEVKNEMKEIGYFERIRIPEIKSYTLPNTTLWKKEEELRVVTVLNDLQEVISVLNKGIATKDKIILEKAMAVEFTTWKAIEN